mmetsp:Transcript_28312/g.34393  ORF Transcript_28312/g.34393 Transcript_28312/m.34393 type:complete len:384 (-) Transcript_28312:108-1259(-)|eukprot:CAMPEP_0197864388 /NCGR_PEP_ID=MMETSP1438-20131217/42586_1 /TAXON_ID=1461541 /ORGANISM="Pterosperma sp., Strain CCMP1384" /LENGTH=383 /DNA_ID=CAMNT_0043482621 /DNA_START=106 /DNA_END=1257 /DNA_ORIENTATION=-
MIDAVCAACGKPAKLQCPKCLELKLPTATSSFCSQECFKQSWPTHKKVHKVPVAQAVEGYPQGWLYVTKRGRNRQATMPNFDYPGDLRPYPVSPPSVVPQNIPRPDYADHPAGYPEGEAESKQQNVIKPRSPAELDGLRKACRLGREALDAAARIIKPGIKCDDIDKVVHKTIVDGGGYPSPLNYYNFPKSVCTSVNEIICHGIPDAYVLKEGDVVNVDVTACLDGYHGDLNETFTVGECDEETKKLVRTAYECLEKAIATVKPGMRYRDVGDVITRHASQMGMSVVKTYCGHGIGDLFHCAPNIPHYAKNKAVGVMKPGHTFTIEPMINAGTWKDVTWVDGWTASTADGKKSAQFEHTMAVTDTGVEILTARLPTSPPLGFM